MIIGEQIIAALKKIGPCRPGELADHLEVEHSAIGYHLKKMLEAGTLKAIGNSAARRIGLPDQTFEEAGAPPQPRAKPKARKQKKHRKAPKARAPQAARPAECFIPVVDAEKRLHIINGGTPVSYDGVQTLAIAELLFAHYEE
jgi:DNA-binding Lrp family transcriptional regulator